MNLKTAINITGFGIFVLLIVIFYQIHIFYDYQVSVGAISDSIYVEKINIAMFIFLFITIGMFLLFRYFERKIEQKKIKEDKNIKNLELINDFYNILHFASGIKNISKVALEFISKQLNCYSASIYISNYKNMKLQLLGVYNRNIDKSTKIIDMYAGTIGEAFASKQIKTNIYKNRQVVAIPLIDNNKTIGVVELKFYSDIEEFKLNKQEKMVFKIITNVLLKEIEDEKNKKYFNLINKNVLLSSTNTDGEITFVSEAFCKATGYNKKELIGGTHQLLRDPDVDNKTFKGLWETIKSGKTWHKDIPNIKKDGSKYWAKTTITPEFDFYGNIIGYDAIREDITDKKLIEQISITDSLTSLYNRRYFDKMFIKQMNLAKRFSKTLIFGILDIDHFKQYNDTYGHQAGDETLKKVAKCLHGTLKREDDLVFRLGGEEFGVLYFVEEEKDGIAIAREINSNVEQLKIEHTKNSASSYVTISCGLYIYKGEDESTEQIYKKADDLLYKAKENGRNNIYFNTTGVKN